VVLLHYIRGLSGYCNRYNRLGYVVCLCKGNMHTLGRDQMKMMSSYKVTVHTLGRDQMKMMSSYRVTMHTFGVFCMSGLVVTLHKMR
jgi:hypothetical protein